MAKSKEKQLQSYLAKVHKRLLTKRKRLKSDLDNRMIDVREIQAQRDSVDADIKALEKAVT